MSDRTVDGDVDEVTVAWTGDESDDIVPPFDPLADMAGMRLRDDKVGRGVADAPHAEADGGEEEEEEERRSRKRRRGRARAEAGGEPAAGEKKKERKRPEAPRRPAGYGNPWRHEAAIVAETRPETHAAGAPARWHYERFVNTTVVDGDALRGLVAGVDRRTRLALASGLVHARGLTRHQIEGFDKFMDVYLPAIVAENARVFVDSEASRRRHVLEFGPVTVHKPSVREANGTLRPVYPRECRMRGLVYACTVTCRLRYTAFDITGLTKERLKERGGDCAGLPLCRETVSQEHVLCQVPCMVGSRYCRLRGTPAPAGECPLERPGTFVVRGSVKMLVSQIKMRINYPCVMVDRAHSKYSHVCEIRPRHESKIRSTSTLYMYLAVARPHVEVKMPFVEAMVPVADVFRLLGVETREAMAAAVMDHACALDPESDARLARAVRQVFDQDDHAGWSRQALCEWLGSVGTRGGTGRDGTGEPAQRPTAREERVRFVEHIMGNEFLPHVGLDRSRETYLRKAHHLGYCVHKLLAVSLGRLPVDDRDHMALKRVDTAAVLMPTLFRPLFRSLCKSASTAIKRRAAAGQEIDMTQIIDHRRLTAILRYALMTGNWSVQKGNATAATGVAQVHNRMTVTSSLSNLRRVSMPMNREGKLPSVRQLRDSVHGLLCPVETPEGSGCGLVTNLALGAHVRVGHDRDLVVACVERAARSATAGGGGGGGALVPVLEAAPDRRRALTQVLVNGVPEGYSPDGAALAAALRDMRQAAALPFDVSIVHRPALRLIEVHCDTGCCLRPLLRVDGLHRVRPLLARYGRGAPPEALFHALLAEGALEYLSKDEEETCRVATDPADLLDPAQQRPGVRRRDGAPRDREPFTHVEVHPVLMLGACASLIPFSEHNQAPRNIYQAAMGKQSKAAPPLNADHAVDTVSHALCYPQVPLVQTAMEDAVGATRQPMGQNVRVAIMCDPYDQEDSLVLNLDSAERGLFRSVIKRAYRDNEKTRGADATRFCRPQAEGCHGLRKADYSKLGPEGYVEPGTRVVPGDALIGKVCNTDEVRDPDAASAGGGASAPAGAAGGAGGGGGGGGQASRVVKRDKSTILRTNEPATVHCVVDTRDADGARAYKLITRAMRQPDWGDKLASRHGQKATVGIARRAHDLPFEHATGHTPDIIINPHAIPSRMTVGMMLEALVGKVACREGAIADGTPFGGLTIDGVAGLLAQYGCERYGKALMYHPHTGEPMEALVFLAPVYYQALRHVAIDKIHARSRGPVQMLTKQPVEGRSRSGGLRLGEMERDCIAGGVHISSAHHSMTIESIVSTSYACTVRSYDTSKDGIEHDEAVAFADKGTRPCVRIYLEDGSHVDSTPDHRFMCADGQWRPANQLEGLRIKKGAQPPPIDLQAEMALLDTNSVREYERTMALFRILGWVLADGHIPRQGQWSVFMGHQFDVDTMLDDIELLSGTRPATRFYPDQGYGSTFRIGIPASISRLLENFDEDIMRGRRSTQPARWPMAILSDECPLPILREFVAALFGGDGSTACLVLHRGKRDQLFGLRFSQSRVKRHVRSLETYMGQLKGMLIRLGIDGDSMNITTHKVKEPDSEFTESGRVRLHANEDVYAVRLHIDVSQIEAFHERIGFRHCVHKATRLEAAVSYYRLRRTVQRQTNWVVQRAKQLSGTVTGLNYTYARAMAEAKKRRRNGGMTTRQAVHRAHDELRAMEPIYNHHYSLPSYEMVLDRLKVVRKDAQAPKMMHKHFPKAEDYLRSISADAFFTGDNEKIVYGVGRDRDTLPVMHLKVIAVKPIGERPVYDIEVAKNHNFLANGVVAHNCIISHGASQFLLERLFEQSDAYSTVVCAACGLLAVPAKPRNAPVVGMAVRGYDEPFCRVCNTGVHVREVKMPYACKLLVQELMACCIAFRFRFDDDDDGGRNNSGNASGAERAPRDEGGERADGTTLEYDDDGGLYLSSGATEETKGSPPPRLEGLGPGGSVLASVPSATLTGILDRVETAVRAASSVTNKRKRVAPRAETP